jgi:hypothetical protein
MSKLKLRQTDLAWRQVEGEVVVVDVRTSTYLSANDSGARLWSRLSEGTTRDELVAELVEGWGVDAGTAATDIDKFVQQLRDNGLLEDEAVS